MADVSVIIPCYNGRDFIARTIESALGQTDPPREVMVIDDGSTDDSAGIVEKKFADHPAVKLLRQANAGESRARNRGIEQAAGEFIAFLDADDLWMPEKLARQLEALRQHPDAIGVHTRVFNFEREIDDLARIETERTMDNPAPRDLMEYHYVTPSSLVVRRDTLIKHHLRFDESTRYSEDMLFAADLSLVGPLRLVDEPLVAKRKHANQQSSDNWHPIYSLETRAGWVRAHRDILGDDIYTPLDGWIGRKMVDVLEDRYWRRRFHGYRAARKRVMALHPKLVRNAGVANRFIWPRWFYLIADSLKPAHRKVRRYYR